MGLKMELVKDYYRIVISIDNDVEFASNGNRLEEVVATLPSHKNCMHLGTECTFFFFMVISF